MSNGSPHVVSDQLINTPTQSPSAPTPPDPGQPLESFSWLAVVVGLLRHPIILTVVPVITAVAVVVPQFLADPEYVAESRFLPMGSSETASPLAGLSAGLGLNLGSPSTPGESVDFYASLLTSRELLTEAATTEYRFVSERGGRDTLVGTIIDLYELRSDEPVPEELLLLQAVSVLKQVVAVDIDRRSDVVTIRTTTKWPALSELINRRLLGLTNSFNLDRRQSQAAAERRFVEARLAERQRELSEAEDAFERFLDRNRSIEDSPQLLFERARLEQQVVLGREVLATLAKSYEEARISEVRNTPVVTVVDSPEGSAVTEGNLIRRALIGIVLGAGLAVGLALTLEFLALQRRQDPATFAEARRLMQELPRKLIPVREREGGA